MKIILVSNQSNLITNRGNPIVHNYKQVYAQLFGDDEITYYVFMKNKSSYHSSSYFKLFKALFNVLRSADIVNVHFSSIYTIPVILFAKILNVKTIITFHGTDLHGTTSGEMTHIVKNIKIRLNRINSIFAMLFSNWNILVSNSMYKHIPKYIRLIVNNRTKHIRLGVDLSSIYILDKVQCRKKLNLDGSKRYFLFSYFSAQSIKRIDIAEAIVDELGQGYELLVMSNVQYNEVPLYLNACDYLLLTSDREGSPNIVREALAVNVPVFAVDVGNIFEEFSSTDNCYCISRDPSEASRHIKAIITTKAFKNTRSTIKFHHSMENMAKKYRRLYHSVAY